MNDHELTDRQKRDIAAAKSQVSIVRGLQAAIVALALYLAIVEKRGIAAVIIGAAIAACYQFAAMPTLPAWLEKHRPKE